MKCELCKETIETTFLEKLKGTTIGSGKKRKAVCQRCQKDKSMEEIKKTLDL